MERNNYQLFVLLIFLLITSLAANAQDKKDSVSVRDAIILFNGEVLYGKVTEINQSEIKYRMTGLPDGAVVTLPRNQVFAISYRNNTTQVITPGAGTATAAATKEVKTSLKGDEIQDTAKHTLSYQMSHGSLKVGLGFSSEYSSFRGIEEYNSTSTTPSFYMSYQFVFNKWLTTGLSFAYASLSYTMNESSEYDGFALSQNLQENVTTIGIFGRYDILRGFVKPYVLMGLDLNYSRVDIDGDMYFIEDGKHILTTSNLQGFKTNIIARAGLDLMLTKRFGVYSDIGTGSTLVQVGAIFKVK